LMYVSTQHFPPHTHTPGTLTLPKSLSRSLSLSLSLSHPHTQHPHTHNTHKTYTHTHTQHTAHTQLNYPPPRDELINMSVHELRAHQALLARQIVEEQVSSSFSSVQERYDKGPGCLSPPHTHTHTHMNAYKENAINIRIDIYAGKIRRGSRASPGSDPVLARTLHQLVLLLLPPRRRCPSCFPRPRRQLQRGRRGRRRVGSKQK